MHRKLEDNKIHKFALYNFSVSYKSMEELKTFFFSLIVQGTYVEVMCRALKTHLMANLSEQIVVISFPLYITFLH